MDGWILQSVAVALDTQIRLDLIRFPTSYLRETRLKLQQFEVKQMSRSVSRTAQGQQK